jgi:small subunit ribosomal protein S17e
MGRIKTKQVKRVSQKLVKDHAEDFKQTFEENKKLVTKHADIPSKKLRNTVAGYVTRLIKEREVL